MPNHNTFLIHLYLYKIRMFSLSSYQNPFFPLALCHPVLLVTRIYPLSIGLPPFEISPPKAILKVYLAHSLLLIMDIGPFIFDAVAFKHSHILLIYLLFSLFYLELGVLGAMSMKEPLVKLPLIPQLLILIVQLPIAVHASIFPLSHICLAIDILVHSLTMSHALSTLIRLPGQCLAHIAAHTTLSRSRVPETFFCHYLGLPQERRLLLIANPHILTIQVHLRLDEGSNKIGVLRQRILDLGDRCLCLFLRFVRMDKGELDGVGRRPSRIKPIMHRIKPIMQIAKGKPVVLMRCQHLLQNIDQMVREAIAANADQLSYAWKVYLATLVAVQPVEVLHGHQGKDDHPERECI